MVTKKTKTKKTSKKKEEVVEKPKGKGRPKGALIPVTDALFISKVEERLPRVNSQFNALNRLNTSRWRKLENHTHDWNAVIRHLQNELEKMLITAEAPSEISDIFEKFGREEDSAETTEESEEEEEPEEEAEEEDE